MGNHRTIGSALNAIEKKIEEVPNRIAMQVNENAKPFTPVRTGRLVSSYELKRSTRLGDDAIAFNNTPYAGYQEFGTIYIPARAMYRQSVQTISKRAEDYMR